MRIHIKDISVDRQVAIAGNEPWLERLYGDFRTLKGVRPQITGKLTLHREEGGSIAVTGRLEYAPIVGCSRCDREIDWPMSFDVSERFLPPPVNEMPKELLLTRADLDAYYLEEHEVDLEALVNDVVQTELPLRLIPVADDGKSCRICKVDVSDERVYSNEDKGETSPFAALKGLKLSD